jgi:ABC-2 type transport system ATP-binding protein
VAASATPPELAVRCRGLVKRYDAKVLAVDGLDLDVRTGECFGLLGPNGAGKTTTVEILEGLLEPTAGDVEVLGMRWASDERALRGRIGVSLQQTHLPDKLTPSEILAMFRSFFARGREVSDVLSAVGLEDKKGAWYDKLSGGQKQRLAVACALVGDPDLLFLDEPTTGLDPQSRLQVWSVIERFKEEGRSVLLTTHYMEEAARLCDRVAIVDGGKVIAQGSPAQLILSLGGQDVVELALASGRVDDAKLAELPSVRAVRHVAGGLALAVDQVHVALPALLAHLEHEACVLERLSTRHATLEDVFVTLTGRNLRD